MTISQTVDIPASRKLVIDVPPEVPEGKAVLVFKPMEETAEYRIISKEKAISMTAEFIEKYRPALEALAQ